MFDTTARSELEEALGYERYLLRACNDAIRQSQGVCGPTTLVIPDEGPNQVCLSLGDTLGDTGAGMTARMSPLIFSAAYKLLDMVVEWTIRENGLDCPFQFARKVAILDNTPGLVYPDFVGTDPAVREVLLGLFKEALPYRNAITHGKWGRNVDGDLYFDFERNGQGYSKAIKFGETLAFAEAMSLVGDLLVERPADPNKLNTLKWLLDRIVSLHGRHTFGITHPRYYRVVRATRGSGDGPVVVDMARVREVVGKQAGVAPAVYDLTVEVETAGGSEAWEIPFRLLPAGDRLVLDEGWNECRISR